MTYKIYKTKRIKNRYSTRAKNLFF